MLHFTFISLPWKRKWPTKLLTVCCVWWQLLVSYRTMARYFSIEAECHNGDSVATVDFLPHWWTFYGSSWRVMWPKNNKVKQGKLPPSRKKWLDSIVQLLQTAWLFQFRYYSNLDVHLQTLIEFSVWASTPYMLCSLIYIIDIYLTHKKAHNSRHLACAVITITSALLRRQLIGTGNNWASTGRPMRK